MFSTSISPAPVFIGGCPRSGTTLLGAMLGAHDDALCVPESHFITDAIPNARAADGSIDTARAFADIARHHKYRGWRLRAGLDADAAATPGGYPALIRRLVCAYGETIGRTGRPLWIDHTPSNLASAATLLRLFPNARLIHIVRDGRGACASVLPLDWGPNDAATAARWWVEHIGHGLVAEIAYPHLTLRLRYEDLLAEPAAQLRRICVFLGITFHERMIAGDGFVKPDYTLAQHVLVGKPPDPARGNAWRHELPARSIEIFEAVTADLLPMLGYPLVHEGFARGPTHCERAHVALFALPRLVRNRIARRRRRRNGLR